MEEFIIVDQIISKPYIIIEQASQLSANWFYNFIFGWKTQLYIYYNNLQLKLTESFTKIKEQFKKDVTRIQFEIDDCPLQEYSIIQKTLKKQYSSLQLKTILFLCSQSSLAFIIEQMHNSLQNRNKNLIIAETQSNKKMKMSVNTKENSVKIEKHLRVVQIINTHTIIEIQDFQLSLHFQLYNDQINCIVLLQ